jgi:hypothetical protein
LRIHGRIYPKHRKLKRRLRHCNCKHEVYIHVLGYKIFIFVTIKIRCDFIILAFISHS